MFPLANMLVQIKNAQSRGLREISVPFSTMKQAIARILQQQGYLASVEELKKKAKKSELSYLRIVLKEHAINGMRLVSKPSRRMYAKANDLGKVKSGYGVAIVSTPKGIMTGTSARQAALGGEVLFEIW